MSRTNASNLTFINSFVDAVTVRPFFEDLRRIKQASAMFRELPRAERLHNLGHSTTATGNTEAA